ncbi:MAG: hypothetical protein GX615_00065, partial [Lentisphaerae bacterium]|nr:hypothetical protein [Lentisphaerota bacterium]
GYLNEALPEGRCRILAPDHDENGFYAFEHLPFPEWSYFEEGPASRTGAGAASVNVTVGLSDGSRKTMRFWPLSYYVSTWIFYDTQVLFEI